LSLKIYLDDCVCAKELVGMLRAKGHDVLTPNDTGTVGESDETHLNTAIAQTRVLITADVEDFSDSIGFVRTTMASSQSARTMIPART
jgi:predicted nuclease of predicted toxin-antitoxin system